MGGSDVTEQEHGPILQIIGDGMRGEWITWWWSNDYGAGGIARRPEWVKGEARQRLLRAVPRTPHRCDANALRELGFEGDLASSNAERSLMASVSTQLLPSALLDELLHVVDTGSGRISVRVAPSPSAAMVPWGLLMVDGERRLLDVADVSWIGPILPRDVDAAAASGSPLPPSWAEAKDRPPLHVIDPELPDSRWGFVLGWEEAAYWRQSSTSRDHSAGAPRTSSVHDSFTSRHLSRELATPRSRLFLLGHCIYSAGEAGFLLSDTRDTYGIQPPPSGSVSRALSATDLLRGTLNRRSIASPEDARIALSAGHARWPMPPRVAIIACTSGADMTDFEPFGLVTAALINGADTVHATLWPLPTDHAFSEAGAGPALSTMARAVDQIQTADDPVSAANQWQRDQLRQWREDPCLETSPLTWGALSTVTAPPRGIVGE